MALSRDFEERQKLRQRQRRIERERRRKLQRVWLILVGILVILIIILCATRCGRKKVNTVIPAEATAAVESPAATEAATEAVTGLSNIPAPFVGNNDFLDVIKNSGQTHHVYLTFDEGPDPSVTPKILDALRRYDVQATFFVIGREIERYPYLITRIIDEGHLVLPLSYSGNSDRLYADKNDFIDEINKTYELICDNSPSAAEPIKIYRFPGGSGENTTYGASKQDYKSELAKNGYYYCDWNTTIGDETGTRTAEQLVQYFKDYRPELNNLIVRLCNTDKNAYTAEALGTIIDNLLNEGCIFSRLDQIDASGAASASEASAEPVAEQTQEPSETATEQTDTAQSTGTTSTGTAANTTTGTAANTATNTAAGSSTSATGSSTTRTGTGSAASSGTASAGTMTSGTAASSNTSSGTAASGTSSSGAASSDSAGSSANYLIPE